MIVLTSIGLAIAAAHVFIMILNARRRRKELAAMHEGEAIAKALVDNSPRGIHFFDIDASGRLIFSGGNRAADSILGIDHSKLVGLAIEEAFPNLADTEIPDIYRRTALEGTEWNNEQITYADGRVSAAYEILTFRTKPKAMAIVFSDISERKRAEKELQDQKSFVNAVLESLPGIYYLYGYPSLTLVHWNKNHETDLGYTHDDLVGKSITSWYPSEAKEAILAAVDVVMERGANSIEVRLKAKDGILRPYLLTGTRFEAAGSLYLMGVGIDISKRLEAEEQLRALNAELEARVAERTQSLSESNAALHDALADVKASHDMLITQEKLAALGQLITGLAHELNTPLGAILSSSETGKAAAEDLGRLFALNRSFNAEEALVFDRLCSGSNNAPILIGIEDRTLKKRFKQVLSEAAVDAPLFVAEMLADSGYRGDNDDLASLARMPRFKEIATAAYKVRSIGLSGFVVSSAARKAAAVVLALRAYSRNEAGRGLVSADIVEQIETALTLLQNRLKAGVDVVRRYGSAPPVLCAPERLGQVWLNLLTNAAQAMDYKGRLIIEVASDPGAKTVSASFIDDGPGVPEAIKDRIFEPFFTTKGPGEGLGLGLDICGKILEEIGATLEMESKPGRTSFTVRMKASEGAGA